EGGHPSSATRGGCRHSRAPDDARSPAENREFRLMPCSGGGSEPVASIAARVEIETIRRREARDALRAVHEAFGISLEPDMVVLTRANGSHVRVTVGVVAATRVTRRKPRARRALTLRRPGTEGIVRRR